MKLFWPQQQNFNEAMINLSSSMQMSLFNEQTLQFLQKLSKSFLQMRHLPEVVALGYWMRKSNLTKIQQQFEVQFDQRVMKPRGTVFHIAPSNVDTIFVYSWILSMLAGNQNIIRLSSKTEKNEILHVIIERLSEFEEVGKRTIICTYDHHEGYTETISALCQTRVIWGGDATIRAVRQVPLHPMANELVFPDRFSLALLNSDAINKCSEEELNEVIEKFYNDVFWFDQMACSSPRLVVWQGKASPTFWERLSEKVNQKNYELTAATQVLKYTTSLQLATETYVKNVSPYTYYSRVKMDQVPKDVREHHCGGGLFFEYEINELEEIADILIDKDQTIVYYGYTKQQLIQLIEQVNGRGIDRIVPIGMALDFSETWDGQNFLTSFTREVVIK